MIRDGKEFTCSLKKLSLMRMMKLVKNVIRAGRFSIRVSRSFLHALLFVFMSLLRLARLVFRYWIPT